MIRLRRKVFRLVQGAETTWRPVDVEFRAGMVLVAACFVGTNEKRLSSVTGFSVEFVRRVSARCRKARIWRGDNVRGAWEAEHGDFAFMLDAMVAAGVISRPADEAITKRNRITLDARRGKGLCSVCGKARTVPERNVCDLCRVKRVESRAKLIARTQGDVAPVPLVLSKADPLYQSNESAAKRFVAAKEREDAR